MMKMMKTLRRRMSGMTSVCLFVCFSFSPLPKPPIPQFPNQMITTLKLYLEKEIVNFKIINVNVLLISCIFFVAFMPFY